MSIIWLNRLTNTFINSQYLLHYPKVCETNLFKEREEVEKWDRKNEEGCKKSESVALEENRKKLSDLLSSQFRLNVFICNIVF